MCWNKGLVNKLQCGLLQLTKPRAINWWASRIAQQHQWSLPFAYVWDKTFEDAEMAWAQGCLNQDSNEFHLSNWTPSAFWLSDVISLKLLEPSTAKCCYARNLRNAKAQSQSQKFCMPLNLTSQKSDSQEYKEQVRPSRIFSYRF